jgi:hypothetical protein
VVDSREGLREERTERQRTVAQETVGDMTGGKKGRERRLDFRGGLYMKNASLNSKSDTLTFSKSDHDVTRLALLSRSPPPRCSESLVHPSVSLIAHTSACAHASLHEVLALISCSELKSESSRVHSLAPLGTSPANLQSTRSSTRPMELYGYDKFPATSSCLSMPC